MVIPFPVKWEICIKKRLEYWGVRCRDFRAQCCAWFRDVPLCACLPVCLYVCDKKRVWKIYHCWKGMLKGIKSDIEIFERSSTSKKLHYSPLFFHNTTNMTVTIFISITGPSIGISQRESNFSSTNWSRTPVEKIENSERKKTNLEWELWNCVRENRNYIK